MKAIMISVKPKWVTKILKGEKTIEIRRTAQKEWKWFWDDKHPVIMPEPIDVYIYCTKSNYFGYISKRYIGKVVAKFTLNKVEEIKRSGENMFSIYHTDCYNSKRLQIQSCLDLSEIYSYLKGKKGYVWHIDNLVIFDKPKELSEFRKYYRSKGFPQNRSWNLIKAPQSWCYVETGE